MHVVALNNCGGMADSKTAGVEASAISLLKEAVALDSERRFTEALVCYREGIQLLMGVSKSMTILNN